MNYFLLIEKNLQLQYFYPKHEFHIFKNFRLVGGYDGQILVLEGLHVAVKAMQGPVSQ